MKEAAMSTDAMPSPAVPPRLARLLHCGDIREVHDRRGVELLRNHWIGRTVMVGAAVPLAITKTCQRCVMITLPQGDLPKDPGILRTAAQHNGVNVGVYASVGHDGTIRSGDPVVLG
jgi:MOSC domain-containing protein YiiM